MTTVTFADWLAGEAHWAGWARADVHALVVRLFDKEGVNLVRLARFFVDDGDAAEDLVQEAFIRLARSVHRVEDPDRVPAYLRSIVLNLARDHNRRGLVSLRHRMRMTADTEPTPDETWQLRDDHRRVIGALRDLPVGSVTGVVLIGMALWLGPFIKRFGRAYAADVFRANPRTGKSFIVLTDIVCYLIFTAYIFFTVRFEPDRGWGRVVGAGQVQASVFRIGGILLIMGILHGLNIVLMPVLGRMFSLNRRLDALNRSDGVDE